MKKKFLIIILLLFLNLLFHFYIYKKDVKSNIIYKENIHPNFHLLLFPDENTYLKEKKEDKWKTLSQKLTFPVVIKYKDLENGFIKVGKYYCLLEDLSFFMNDPKKEQKLLKEWQKLHPQDKISFKKIKANYPNEEAYKIELKLMQTQKNINNTFIYLATAKNLICAYRKISSHSAKIFYFITFNIFNVLIILIISWL